MSGETTAQVEALKRRIHERIGAWFAAHWTQLASGTGGVLVGAFTMYGLFASSVNGAHQAADDAMRASVELKSSVSELKGTVAQLVTQQQLQAALERIQVLEDWQKYAQGWKPQHPLADKLPHPRPEKK